MVQPNLSLCTGINMQLSKLQMDNLQYDILLRGNISVKVKKRITNDVLFVQYYSICTQNT